MLQKMQNSRKNIKQSKLYSQNINLEEIYFNTCQRNRVTINILENLKKNILYFHKKTYVKNIIEQKQFYQKKYKFKVTSKLWHIYFEVIFKSKY